MSNKKITKGTHDPLLKLRDNLLQDRQMTLMGLCENKVLSYEVGVQGDASLRETLATPTWRHEFNPQCACKKPSIPGCACNASAGMWTRSLGLDGEPALLKQQALR